LKTGYLAKPNDSQDLANGINWILRHEQPELLATAARDKVLREFDSKVVAPKYVEVYQQVMRQK
jgi:glycosyltransferase involved in cell wall biosynthesis